MAKKEPTGWITVNGHHVPIYEGESKQDAYNRSVAKMNEDKKAADIAKRKEETDKLNGKSETKSQIRYADEYARKDKGTGLLQSTKDKIDKMKIAELESNITKDKAYLKRLEGIEENRAKMGLGMTDLDRQQVKRSRQIHENTISYMEKKLKEKVAESKSMADKSGADTLFKFDWSKLSGSATAGSQITKYLKANNIPYFTTKYFTLVADVDGDGKYYEVTHTGNGVVKVDKRKVYKKGD